MNVNWLMKNFIDRLSYLMHRPNFFGKRFMILITSGSYMGIKAAIKALSPIASGGKIISRVGVMNSPGMNDSKISKEEKKLSVKAKIFAITMQKKQECVASLPNMLWFAAFKATSSVHAEDFPSDFKYYQNKQFFVKIKLNILQRGTIRLFTSLFLFLLKRGMI
jgi:hypothetical protein